MNHIIWVTRQTCRKVFIRVGRFVMANLLLVMLTLPAQAQTFDQAVTGAAVGCPDVTSSGSTGALSRAISPVEKQKSRRLIGPLSLFISSEYERSEKDRTTFEKGHTTDTWRTALGADYSFNERVVFGGALNVTNAKGDFQSGGRFDTDSYGLLLHANFVPAPKFFFDAAAGYTRNNHSVSRIVSCTNILLGPVEGDTEGDTLTVGVNGGYDFAFQNITIGPRFGLHYKPTKIDGYSERGSTGMELVYDNQTEKSLTSVLGMYGSMAISTRFGVLIPQTTLEHVHEFKDNQRTTGLGFSENTNTRFRTDARFGFQNDSPDRNYFNLGAGVVAVLPNGFSPFINYRTLLGYQARSSYGIAAGLRIEL